MSDAVQVACPSCGAVNRVAPEKVARGLAARCGRCKTPLLAGEAPVMVTDATFAALVEHSPVPVLLDAWAPWCAPCRQLAPIVDQLAKSLAGRVRVAKLDVDQNPQTARRFGLRSIPTLLVFQDGAEVDRLVGLQPRAEIERRLERVLG
jgi:thioredoxin 2